jgi:hypothetical protein
VIKHVVEVTPTLDTNAFATGDQIGSTYMTITGAAPGKGAGTILSGLVITDGAAQGVALDLFFFDAAPTVASSENAAANVSAAEMADKCIGHVSIATTDYKALSANTTACLRDLAMSLKPAQGSQDLYCLIVSRGAPTYGATSLTFKFVFDWE